MIVCYGIHSPRGLSPHNRLARHTLHTIASTATKYLGLPEPRGTYPPGLALTVASLWHCPHQLARLSSHCNAQHLQPLVCFPHD